MESSTLRRAMILTAAACLATLLVLGCSKDWDKSTKPEDGQNLNSDKPNANSRILSQTMFGDAEKQSYIRQLERDGSLGFYFRTDKYNNTEGVGRLSATGTPLWFAGTVYYPIDIRALTAAAAVPGGLVAVGGHDTDGANGYDNGYVSVFSSAGSLTSQILYASDTSDVWLNSIALLSDSMFVGVGGEKTAAGTRPFIAVVALASSGQLEKRHQATVNTIPNRHFYRVAVNPAELTGPDLSLYVLSEEMVETEHPSMGVHKVSTALPGLAPLTVEWGRDISATAQGTTLWDLCLSGENLYVVGSADDPGKPLEGGYWSSGVAASLTLAGDLRWIKLVSLTQHSDDFSGVTVSSDALYAAGCGGAYKTVPSNESFGYGWICQIAPTTGDVVSNMTFGQDSYLSDFCDAILSGDVIYCGGRTQEEIDGGPYRSWFCEIDAGNPSPIVGSPAPARAQAGERRVADDWSNESRR